MDIEQRRKDYEEEHGVGSTNEKSYCPFCSEWVNDSDMGDSDFTNTQICKVCEKGFSIVQTEQSAFDALIFNIYRGLK